MNRFVQAAVAAGCLAAAATAMARDTKVMVPVDRVMAQPETQRILGGMLVRFGAPSPDQRGSWPPGSEINARSWARPFQGGNIAQLPDGRPVRISDEDMCALALRNTLDNLVREARNRGAQSVVEVVSMVGNAETNSPTHAECRAGDSSGVISLKGRVAGPGGAMR